MKRIFVSSIFALLCLSCATQQPASFRASQNAYDRDFDTVWKACHSALKDYTIESSNKDIRQIVTKVFTKSTFAGYADTVVTVKVSETRPYLVQVMAASTPRIVSASVIGGVGQASGAAKSDANEENRILGLIDSALK